MSQHITSNPMMLPQRETYYDAQYTAEFCLTKDLTGWL